MLRGVACALLAGCVWGSSENDALLNNDVDHLDNDVRDVLGLRALDLEGESTLCEQTWAQCDPENPCPELGKLLKPVNGRCVNKCVKPWPIERPRPYQLEFVNMSAPYKTCWETGDASYCCVATFIPNYESNCDPKKKPKNGWNNKSDGMPCNGKAKPSPAPKLLAPSPAPNNAPSFQKGFAVEIAFENLIAYTAASQAPADLSALEKISDGGWPKSATKKLAKYCGVDSSRMKVIGEGSTQQAVPEPVPQQGAGVQQVLQQAAPAPNPGPVVPPPLQQQQPKDLVEAAEQAASNYDMRTPDVQQPTAATVPPQQQIQKSVQGDVGGAPVPQQAGAHTLPQLAGDAGSTKSINKGTEEGVQQQAVVAPPGAVSQQISSAPPQEEKAGGSSWLPSMPKVSNPFSLGSSSKGDTPSSAPSSAPPQEEKAGGSSWLPSMPKVSNPLSWPTWGSSSKGDTPSSAPSSAPPQDKKAGGSSWFGDSSLERELSNLNGAVDAVVEDLSPPTVPGMSVSVLSSSPSPSGKSVTIQILDEDCGLDMSKQQQDIGFTLSAESAIGRLSDPSKVAETVGFKVFSVSPSKAFSEPVVCPMVIPPLPVIEFDGMPQVVVPEFSTTKKALVNPTPPIGEELCESGASFPVDSQEECLKHSACCKFENGACKSAVGPSPSSCPVSDPLSASSSGAQQQQGLSQQQQQKPENIHKNWRNVLTDAVEHISHASKGLWISDLKSNLNKIHSEGGSGAQPNAAPLFEGVPASN